MHQNDPWMGHGTRRGRWLEHPKEADLPHSKNYVSVQFTVLYNL